MSDVVSERVRSHFIFLTFPHYSHHISHLSLYLLRLCHNTKVNLGMKMFGFLTKVSLWEGQFWMGLRWPQWENTLLICWKKSTPGVRCFWKNANDLILICVVVDVPLHLLKWFQHGKSDLKGNRKTISSPQKCSYDSSPEKHENHVLQSTHFLKLKTKRYVFQLIHIICREKMRQTQSIYSVTSHSNEHGWWNNSLLAFIDVSLWPLS